MADKLIPPHGSELKELLVDRGRAGELRDASRDWPSLELTPRQLCDLELLLNGGFSPLTGFMDRRTYESVRDSLRLPDGTLWPIPITLDVPVHLAGQLDRGLPLALRDPEGVILAVLWVQDTWEPDLVKEAARVYGTRDKEHPGVKMLLDETRPCFVGGRLEGLQLPTHYDFRDLRGTPGELRAEFERLGWHRVVAFQTRNPMHRAHQELTLRAAKDASAKLLVHPVVGMTMPGDVDHFTRVRCYQALLPRYPKRTARLALLNLAMRMAGPREAVWHAIIRKNHGCTHFIVGRDHAGPGVDSGGRPFYGPYEAQELIQECARDLGVEVVPFRKMVYVSKLDRYLPVDEVPKGLRIRSISGTELRARLGDGCDIPAWFTFPEVAAELHRSHPPTHRQGFTVFFTGLSGAGKSTVAGVLRVKLLEIGGRSVTLLDGDLVRKKLSSELGFSKEHRDLNIRRIGFVASEITRAGGIAICAPIAPYDSVRKENRALIEQVGGYVLVYVSTPLETCEQRDRKGLYAKARAGIIRDFTGISDPYEAPGDAEVVIDMTNTTPEEAAQQVLVYLQGAGYIAP